MPAEHDLTALMQNEPQYTILRDSESMGECLRDLARQIVAGNPDINALVMLGILTRGLPLAERLAGIIGEMTGFTPPVGALATTLYRDDVRAGVKEGKFGAETHFAFDVDDTTVLLVDDVVAAGRTIRAAMDEVMDYGRPRRIQLACLVDRGGRELPIQPDYLAFSVATETPDWVLVRLKEVDGEDAVLEEHRQRPPAPEEE